MRKLVAALAMLGVSLLAACGGAELGGTGEKPDPVPQGPIPKAVSLSASSEQLSAGADEVSEGVTLTAVVKDGNNVVMAGIPVTFAASGTAEIVPLNGGTTDDSGRATAVLTTGGDTQPRAITVSVSVGALNASRTINVVSASRTVALSASPSQLSSGADQIAEGVTVTAIVKDNSNRVLANIPVVFSASSGELNAPNPALTDANGRATAVLTTGGDPALRDIVVRAESDGALDATLTVPVVSSRKTVVLLVSSAQLSSGADQVSEGVTLTAIVKDDNNVVMAGIPVAFAASGTAEINLLNGGITDANGRATAVLTTGGDSQNRSIAVSAAVDTLVASQTIVVVGSQLNLSGPATVQSGGTATYTVLVTDSSGSGVAGETVTASASNGATVTPFSRVTNSAGIASFDLSLGTQNTVLTVSAQGQQQSKPVTVSADVLRFAPVDVSAPASGCAQLPIPPGKESDPAYQIPLIPLGTDHTVQLKWLRNGSNAPAGTLVNFGVTRGTLNGGSSATLGLSEDATAAVTIRSTQAGFSTITASSTAFDHPSVSCRVQFVSTTPSKISVQAFPATLSINQASDITVIVRDAADNPVVNQTIDFSLDDVTSGELSASSAVTNSLGVATVSYQATSQASATDGVKITGTVRGTLLSDTAKLTVGGRAVNITIGTGSDIIVKDVSTYQDAWTVLVNDSAGNPVPDADFKLSVRSIRYIKGTRSDVRLVASGALPPSAIAVCESEDLNHNDFFDPAIDFDENGNGKLEPGRIAAVPGTLQLDADGSAQFLVTYPKEFGEFVRVELVAIASVAGSETTVTRQFWLRITENDAPHLPNAGPLGVIPDCAIPG